MFPHLIGWPIFCTRNQTTLEVPRRAPELEAGLMEVVMTTAAPHRTLPQLTGTYLSLDFPVGIGHNNQTPAASANKRQTHALFAQRCTTYDDA